MHKGGRAETWEGAGVGEWGWGGGVCGRGGNEIKEEAWMIVVSSFRMLMLSTAHAASW